MWTFGDSLPAVAWPMRLLADDRLRMHVIFNT